eukprot:7412898-Ditylum_brightwellii.AAC.1
MKSQIILDCILPGSTIPTFADESMNEKQFITDTTQLILAADNKEELDLVTDAQVFNCWGNSNDDSLTHKFVSFCVQVLEMGNGAGAHCH